MVIMSLREETAAIVPRRPHANTSAAHPSTRGADKKPHRRRRASDGEDPVQPGTADDEAPAVSRRLPLLLGGITAVACVIVQALALSLLAWRLPELHEHLTLVTLTGALASVAVALAAGALGSHLGRRLGAIRVVLDHTRVGDYSVRVPRQKHDEIGALAHSVNRLVTTSANREKRILESALADPLTGLPNRTLLTERLRHLLTLSRRQPTPFALAVIDLDRFKFVNDSLGHAAGDSVLLEVARRLRATVRDTDTVARLGGDEFVLLLTGGEQAVREVATRIMEAMKAPMVHMNQRIDIGLSIGIALHPQHGSDDRILMRHADSAMYRAKRKRLGFEIFNGESHEIRRGYLSMLGELRTAMETGQLVLEYQPKLDVRSGLIVGFEGLVRWRHPKRGMVHPAEFVQFAEQSGFIREMSLWVLNEGARFSHKLSEQGLDLAISVNVSAQDIENPDFARNVERIIRAAQPRADRLCLEITESGLVSETEVAVTNLRAIAELGVRLAVDDFGTGYATLKQLQNLPVHELKVDRSFVSGMNENRGSRTIVRSTIELGKQLGMRVVAEGVETVAELRSLAAMGCDEIQGYYVAKPMSAQDVVAYVSARNALQAATSARYSRLESTAQAQ